MLAPTAAALLLALSAAPDPAALAQRVQGFYERTRDLEARFTQTYTYASFGRSQVSKGRLRVKKPGMMRWDYESPAPKTVAVKGKRLVQYEPEENQAFVDEKFDASAMSAVSRAFWSVASRDDSAMTMHVTPSLVRRRRGWRRR